MPGVGDAVEVRGERWRLTAVTPFDGCALVTLAGLGSANGGEQRELIAPFDRPRPCPRPPLRPASRRHALAAAVRAVASAAPHGGLRALVSARASLLWWQLAPALALTGGHARVLIADEVGLGKTVQAGLAAAELVARGDARRLLIVTPAGLRAQWVDELRRRFGLAATLVDQARLARDRAEMPAGANPWTRHALAVTSIDLIRQSEVAAALDHLPLDLLIVDEAHHAAPGTDRGRAISRLADHALHVLLLTATPHTGNDEAYRALLTMGAGGGVPAVVFRRTAASVGLALPQRTHVLRVATRGVERALVTRLDAYRRWLQSGAATPAAAGLLASVLARRAASSPASLARTLRRRRALLADEAVEAAQPSLPWDEMDARDDCVPDEVIGARVRPDAADERRRLDDLITVALAVSATGSSKLAALRRLLRRVAEPALVFTEYRDTLDDLACHLDGLGPLALLHGGLPRTEREAAVARFVRGDARVLLATDAGSEGLNLQARCRFAVNVEAPPSPTRMAQRAGRLARLGQARRVHVFTLAGPHDREALARLAGRGEAIAQAWTTATDAHAAAATLGEAARRECTRLATLRRLLSSATPGEATAAPCALLHRGRLARHWRVLVTAVLRDASGRDVETTALAVDLTWTGPARRRWRDVRAALRAVERHPAVTAVLESRRRVLTGERASHHDGVAARARLLLAATGRRPRRFQPSLFDGRASAAERRDEAARAAERAWWAARVESRRDATTITPVDPPIVRCAIALTAVAREEDR